MAALPPSTRRPVWPRVLLAAVLVAAAVAGYLLIPDPAAAWATARSRLADWKRFVDEHWLAAAAGFVLLYVAVTALSLPLAVPLSLTGGALFGRWVGTLLSVTAATCGGTLAFLASRYVLRDWVRARFGGRLRAVEAGVARDGAFYLLTLRLVPVVPFTLTNLGLGLTPMRTGTFAAVSWVGMLPGGFVFANAGAAAAAVESPADVLSPGLLGALTLLGVLPLAARWVVRAARPGIVGGSIRTEGGSVTVHDLAERVLEERKAAWAKADPKTAIVATGQLGPDDEAAVRRAVAAAGYAGAELEEMARQVAERVVGRVQALSDTLPASGGD